MIDIYEVTKKLIGRTFPIGETNSDEKSFENQKELEQLISSLIGEILYISREKERCEDSISKAGKQAFRYLKSLRDDLNETVDGVK